jgi:N-acetylglutamate synthase
MTARKGLHPSNDSQLLQMKENTCSPYSSHIIRIMCEDDLSAARCLWAKTEGLEIAAGDSEAELAAYLKRNPSMSMVAEVNNVLIGTVLAGHDCRRGYLYHLAVAREARGIGVGQHLVEQALSGLKAVGIVRVLILVARENVSGELFWKHQGWEELTSAQPMGFDL